jgi:acyl-homoserine-lactone acylase
MGTPSGLADPALAVRVLEEAAEAVRERYGSLEVPFGDVYRVRRDDLDLPGNGMSGPAGVFRAAGYGPAGDGKFQIGGGDSFVLAVEFGNPISAMAVTGYGNASQPGSRHRTDQLQLFSEKRMRPVWRTREEIEANLDSRMRWE